MRTQKWVLVAVISATLAIVGGVVLLLSSGQEQEVARVRTDEMIGAAKASSPPEHRLQATSESTTRRKESEDMLQTYEMARAAKAAEDLKESLLKESSLPDQKKTSEIDTLLSLLATDLGKLSPSDKEAIIRKIKDLARANGDDAVAAIMNRFSRKDTDFGFRHEAIVALQAIDTANARQALLDISLGKTETQEASLREWAARAFVSGAKTSEDGAVLLDATDVPGVQNVGLHFLSGKSFSDQTASKVAALMKSENQAVRWSAASAMGKEPQGTHATLYVDSLRQAIAGASETANAQDTYPRDYFTYAEMDRFKYLEALSQMPADVLEGASRQTSGAVAQSVAIALARQGGTGGVSTIRATLKDSNAGLMRLWAAQALGKIGTAADLPLLESVAKTDSLSRRDPSRTRIPGEASELFPVREAAKGAIAEIKARNE